MSELTFQQKMTALSAGAAASAAAAQEGLQQAFSTFRSAALHRANDKDD